MRSNWLTRHPLPNCLEIDSYLKKVFFESRNKVFRAASEYVQQQSDPVLLIGDFNVTMWLPYYRKLVHKTGLRNTRKGFGTLPTWPANMSYHLTRRLNPLACLV